MPDPTPAPSEASPLGGAPAEAPAPDPTGNLYPTGGETTAAAADTQGGDTFGGDSNSGGTEGADSLSGDTSGADTQSGEDSIAGFAAADLVIPEGMEANDELLAAFTTQALEAGLSKDNAQKLLDLHLSEVAKLEKASGEAFLASINEWRGQVMADPDIGGSNFKNTETVLGRALDTYGSKEARDAFDATGAGWHPAIVKFVYNMARSLNEGAPVAPKGPTGLGKRTAAAVLYGDNPQS